MFSSNPQLAEQWSIIMLPTGLPPMARHGSYILRPRRKRMCLITTSCVSIRKRSTCKTYTVARAVWSGNGYVRYANEWDCCCITPRHIEHDNARARLFHKLRETYRDLSSANEVIHNLTTTTTGSIRTTTLRTGESYLL